MGLNTDASAPYNESGVGRTGGYRYHGETENQHATVGASTGAVDMLLDSGDTDNRPRFYVLRYIQRVEPWSPAG